MTNLTAEKLADMKTETLQFARENGICWVRLEAQNKKPIDKDWTNPAVYEPNQQNWAEEFLAGRVNLGFMCGAPSKGLIGLDFDTEETWQKLKHHFEGKTTVIKSGSGKIHVYLKTHECNLPSTRRIHEGNVGIDIQSTGTCIVAPASQHPKTGKYYEFISKYPPLMWEGDIVYDVEEWIKEDFKLKIETEKVDVQRIVDGVGEGERDHAAIMLASYYRSQGKSKEETRTLMHEWNQRNKPPMENADWWINVKIESAFKHDHPYRYKFQNSELYSAEVRKQAEQLLNNPEQIVPYIREATIDIVDEELNKVVCVLLLFGKQSVEVSGESGAGKSNLADASVDMLPKDWVEKITSMSPHALRHTEKPSYRCIYLAERRGLGTGKAGQETEADYDMKVSISEGMIKAQIAEKKPNGQIVTITKEIRIESFLMTTTEIAPPPELANRIWNISIDESPQHTKRVIQFILEQETMFPDKRAANLVKPKREVLRCMFSIIERETEGLSVIIPYARALNDTIPTEVAGVFRHTKKMLGIIKIIARLYYRKCQRTDKYIIAPPEAYTVALDIGEEAIVSQFLNMTKKQREFWDKLKSTLKTLPEMTLSDVVKETKCNNGSVRAWVLYLEDMGLITSRMEGQTKVIQMRTDNVVLDKFKRASMPAIEKAYGEWIKPNPLPVTPKPVSGSIGGTQ